MPLVSVIVPVHNGEVFLAEALASALAQTHPDVEVIVVDDGSTDGTGSVLERFAGRITALRQPNRGVSAARNRGLTESRGAYVGFLDSDDIWKPTFLERLTSQLDRLDERVAGVVGGWQEIDAAGQRRPGTVYGSARTYTARDLALRAWSGPSGVLLRRSAVVDAGGWDERFPCTQDWDLWLRLVAAGRTFVGVDEVLWFYRTHDNNLSRHLDLVRADALRLAETHLTNPALPSDVRALLSTGLGTFLFATSVRLYERGRDEEGQRAFAEAVNLCPALLRDEGTYWALLCAEQPLGGKAGPDHLELEHAAARVLAALEKVFAAPPVDPALTRRAFGHTYGALAQLAYGQRRMAAARRYAARALRADPHPWRDRRVVGLWLKSLAGPAVIETASRLRKAVGGKGLRG